jgi:isopentenyldiphosphate isomerase
MHDVVAEKLIFRTANALIFNSDGDIWVQRRLKTDIVFPDMLDFAPGGVVQASDESDEAAIQRELMEELGLMSEVQYVDSVFVTSSGWRWWSVLYKATASGPFTLNPTEVQSVELMTPQEVKLGLEKLPFTPNSKKSWPVLERLVSNSL